MFILSSYLLSQSLIDDIIDSVNNLVYQGVGSLETGLFGTPPERLGFKSVPSTTNGTAQPEQEYPDAKQEIEEGLHKLETLLNSTVDKNFDKFEIYVLRNILSVPADVAKWVRLSHYEAS
jgi:kinetochore protein Mis12/MTW1